MKNSEHHNGLFPRAFTLIELLTVIAIMSVLAALIFPVSGAMKKRAIKVRAQTELAQVETAIEQYKTKHGFYPPDNPGRPAVNQLYYELVGTVLTNLGGVDTYRTLDGSAQIAAAVLPNPTFFGPPIMGFDPPPAGFVNSSRAGGGEEGPVARAFLTGLKPTQIGELDSGVKLLVCSVLWPDNHVYQPTSKAGFNPWRYISSNPTNNPAAYDLWVDLMIGGQTNRICNWSRQPRIVGQP